MGTSSQLAALAASARAFLSTDFERVRETLGPGCESFRGARVLVTGAYGFLGFQFLHFLSHLNDLDPARPVAVVAADNGVRGVPLWASALAKHDPRISLRMIDVTRPWEGGCERFDFIVHAASIASPIAYRAHPIETLDANVTGLRNMLDLAREGGSRALLYFSSSEIYGDPPTSEIPTREEYRGNVSCIGPRACYDESKRLGETLCWLYAREKGVRAKIARPFNNYGPGLRLEDGRVLPDFFREGLAGRDLVLLSDGTPSRTFCYASDALAGYLLLLLSDLDGDPVNIGTDEPEISMRDLARLVLETCGNPGTVRLGKSPDADYLTHNPARRCPDIGKARRLLGFSPRVGLQEGLARLMTWYRGFRSLEEVAAER